MEESLRNSTFIKDSIPSWFAAAGYVMLAAVSTATIPSIFPQVKWYLVLVSYVIAPALAFCNSYGTGLTDWSLASTYGKIGLFVFASLVGSNGGVIAGLAACGVMMSIVSTAADLMQVLMFIESVHFNLRKQFFFFMNVVSSMEGTLAH
jgi:OPT oligopeptide transporter protein